MLRMQRKSMGHLRRKHGAQETFPVRSLCGEEAPSGNPGPVNSGEVLPNGTTNWVPTAAARCIGPVSFVSNTRHNRTAAQNSRSEVFPAKLTIGTLDWSVMPALIAFVI